MNKKEAKEIIKKELEPYRAKPYSELVKIVGADTIAYELTSVTGNWYQIEIWALWDDKPNGNIRVFASIDDRKGWRAFIPITDCFIKSPSGEFVGE